MWMCIMNIRGRKEEKGEVERGGSDEGYGKERMNGKETKHCIATVSHRVRLVV